MKTKAEAGTRRRRRTPEAAQREIIEAARDLLRERPFRELTVDEVMRRTGLSRPSFYVYFKDRHDLVLRVVGHMVAEMMVPSSAWLERGGPDALGESLAGAVEIYSEHAPVFRALADAAADDVEVESAYNGLVQTFIDMTCSQVKSEIEAGRAPACDVDEVCKAMVWMAERYLYLSFAPGTDTDQARIVDTLHTVFRRAYYGAA